MKISPRLLFGKSSVRDMVLLLGLVFWSILTASVTVRAQTTANLVPGSDGNFYGTTSAGGADGSGTFIRVTPAGATTILYSFTGGGDGGAPKRALATGIDGNFYGTTSLGGDHGSGTAFRVTTAGTLTTLFSLGGGNGAVAGFIRGSDNHFYGTGDGDESDTIFKLLSHPAFFDGQTALGDSVRYLSFPDGNPFGYYAFLADANYIYHFDLGYEYVFDASDGHSGVYLYDFKSNGFFYTSPTFPFPYLYDFTLNTVLYYYPDPNTPGHYNTNGYRFFYRFDNGQIIVK